MSISHRNPGRGTYIIQYGIYLLFACSFFIEPTLVFAQSKALGAIRGKISDQRDHPLAGIYVQVTKESANNALVQALPYYSFSSYTWPPPYPFSYSYILPPWIPEEFRQGLSEKYFFSWLDFPTVYKAQSQSNGTFFLKNLPEGRYILWAYDSDNRGLMPHVYGFQEDRTRDNQEYGIYTGIYGGRPHYIPIRVRSERISGPINITMEMGGIISGKITDAQDGSAIRSAKILARLQEEDNWDLSYSAAAVTDLKGNFIFSGLEEGDYIVEIMEAEEYINPSESSGEDIFKVVAGQTTANCNLSLTRGGEIFGHITNQATGEPLAEALVSGFKAYYDGNSFPEGYGSPYSTVKTAIDGMYRLTGLEEGTYMIMASDISGGFQGTSFFGAHKPDPNLEIHVEQGEQVGPIDVTVPLSTGQGAIRGRIAEAGTGLPISGITAHLGLTPSTSNMGSLINIWSTTSHEGIFEFSGLENYTYFLTISDPTGTYLISSTPAYSYGNQCEWAVNPDVAPKQPGKIIHVSLNRGGCLEGQILDGPTPVAGVEVKAIVFDADLFAYEVYRCSWPSYAFDQLVLSSDISDTEGRFSLCGLDTREYFIRAQDLFHRGYRLSFCEDPSRCNMPRSFSVPLRTKMSNLVIPMRKGSTLSGKVVDKAHNPLPFIQVEAIPQKLSFLDPNRMTDKDFRAYTNLLSVPVHTYTKEDGAYTVRGLFKGTYMIIARDPNSLYLSNCRSGVSVSSLSEGIVPDLILSRGSILSGRITNTNGQPLSEIKITAYRDSFANDEDDPALSCPCLDDARYFETKTATNGMYQIHTLPAGNYRLNVEGPDREYLAIEYDDTPLVSVGIPDGEEEILDLDFCLKRGGIIRGAIKDAMTGQALSGVYVRAEPVSDTSSKVYHSLPSDDQGHYTLIGLEEGSYYISVFLMQNYHIQYYPEGNSHQEASPLDIVPDQILDDIDFNLARGVGIVCIGRDAITGEEIIAREYSLQLIDGQGVETKADFFYNTFPPHDPNSKAFILSDLPPAMYRIQVTDCRGYYPGYYYQEGDDPERGTPLTLSQPGSLEKIEVLLYPKASISGKVMDTGNQKPLYKRLVAAIPAHERAPALSYFHDRYTYYSNDRYSFDLHGIECALTDPNGRYRIINVEEGDYRVLAVDPWYIYEDQYYDDLPTEQWQQADSIRVNRSESVTGITIGLHLGVTYSEEASGYPYREEGTLKIISEPEKKALAGRTYTYHLKVENPGAEGYLTYILRQGPQNMKIDSKTSLLQWQPTNEDKGRTIIQVAVYTSEGRMALQSFGLQVEEDRTPPAEVSNLHAIPGIWHVTLSWSSCHDSEGDLAEQVLYIDDGYGYNKPIILEKTITEYTVKQLVINRRYTFRISTRDFLGNESEGVIIKAIPKSTQTCFENWFWPWSFWDNNFYYGFSFVNLFPSFTGNAYPFREGTSPLWTWPFGEPLPISAQLF